MAIKTRKKKAGGVSSDGRKGAGDKENDDQGIAELGQKLQEERLLFVRMNQVGTELGQARRGFRAAQAVGAGI